MGDRLDLKLASYSDFVFALMMFGFTPKHVARMVRRGVKLADIEHFGLPKIVVDEILNKSSRKLDIHAYYKALCAWGRKYRARNRIGGANLFDFNGARAQVLRTERDARKLREAR